MAEQTLDSLTEQLEDEALRIEKASQLEGTVKAKEEDSYDGFTGEKLKLIPTPNFSGCNSVGTLLPINMANETVTNLSQLSQQFDFVTFIKEKLGYSSNIRVCQSFASEQIDALVLAIKSFEKNNAFILGDMAGIGKGRVCAGVLRYAYQNGFIPVFITHKPYLFNDIYRDVKDIDSFGYEKVVKFTNEGIDYSENSKIMPKPFILHQDGSVYDKDGSLIAAPPSYKAINEICESVTEKAEKKGIIELPKEYNCVFLPYSTLSMSKKPTKQNFLQAIAPKCIFVFDESHNAASSKIESNILKRAIPIVNASKAVLFSSATYAKTPSVFGLYVVKTALSSAVPSLESITDALKVGGENVSEYIASGLVKEGQMIRRQRSFGDCKKVTDYVGMRRTLDIYGNTNYDRLEDDTQREFYDEAIGYFKELREFTRTDLSRSAILRAILRKCSLERMVVVDTNVYESAKNASYDSQEREFFKREYRGKWVITSDINIHLDKKTFRENLFLAIKSKYTADKIIETLLTPVNYTNVDGTIHNAPMKPLIAIRNTGEAVFSNLKLKEGDEINNDFAEYLRAIYLKMFTGNFTVRKVDSNIFESISSLTERDARFDEEQFDYEVELSDFFDNGQKVTEIQSKLDSYTSNVPFSAIDYLRHRIETTERPSFYYLDDNKINPKYGQASSSNFKMGEGTSRNHMLKYNPETGKWIYLKNDRIKSTTQLFRSFNNGAIDVMLINVVASTGGSAHSSPAEGIDTRPRNMFIIQFELDINTEVQKRGRINRTGQLNNPTYTYIITRIPAEKRTYLMFRKKLRKLDANTSADQTSSSKDSEMNDDEGNVVEDIFNAYGFDVFNNDFIELPENEAYKTIYDNLNWRVKNAKSGGKGEQDELNSISFNSFIQELELYPAAFQETFFNEMNRRYIEKIIQLKARDEYQVELEAKNYKAALKQRVVIALNSGDTVFSLPLFITDYYTLDDKKVLSKDKVQQKVTELATLPDGRALSPREFHINLIEDYQIEWQKSLNILLENYTNSNQPKREDFEDDERYDIAVQRFVAREAALRIRERDDKNKMLDLMRFFKPNRPVQYDNIDGVFVGYKIKDTGSRFKYSNGSIEFIFCFLAKYPVLHFKVSSDYEVLDYIRSFSQAFANDKTNKAVKDWTPDLNKRSVKRFLSGNILSGIIEANKKKSDGEIYNWTLTRFTNIDNSINTAVQLKYVRELSSTSSIETSTEDLSITSNNVDFVEYVKMIPNSYEEILPIWNVENEKNIDRSMCILKRRSGRLTGTITDIVNVEIFQQYVKKENEIKEIVISEKGVVPARYNKIYHDNLFLDKYKDYQIENGVKRSIQYGLKTFIQVLSNGRGFDTKTKFNLMTVNVKSYNFDISTTSGYEALKNFFKELHNKYDTAFNFRSDASSYYNIENQPKDPFIEMLNNPQLEKKKLFDEGVYQYRFIRKIPDSIIDGIPNVINRTFDSVNGGIELSYPMNPTLLPSYEMKPYRFPNEVMIKLVFSVLSDADKLEFAKKLEDKAMTEDAYQIGQFVSSFLSNKTVNLIYFVGDLRTSEYGLVFKEYALKNDVQQIFFEEDEEKIKKEAKTKVTFEDAEKFLFALI
jgi:hypothetical protein